MGGLAEYLDMGGYARYVWPSYGIVVAAIVLNIIWARGKLKRARKEALRADHGKGHVMFHARGCFCGEEVST